LCRLLTDDIGSNNQVAEEFLPLPLPLMNWTMFRPHHFQIRRVRQ
jgi:hypothetical protein